MRDIFERAAEDESNLAIEIMKRLTDLKDGQNRETMSPVGLFYQISDMGVGRKPTVSAIVAFFQGP